MRHRRPLSRRRSKRSFKRGRKINKRNFRTASMRGGYRI